MVFNDMKKQRRKIILHPNTRTDMSKILKLIKSDDNMDYNDDFIKLDSILNYHNKSVIALEKIQFRGGNEENIKRIVSDILSYLIEKGYYDQNDDLKPIPEYEYKLRKITFFLVLNTDATFKYNLEDDNYICHVLNRLPKLPKCLLIHMIWGLNLCKYFYEIIKYTPCWFALQFIESSINMIKYLEPYETLETIENLLISIFENMCRSEFRKLEIIDRTIILNKYYDYIIEILRQFYTPDIEKFQEWSKTKFYKYHGFAIKHLVDTILYCFNAYETPIKCKLDNQYSYYEVCTEKCPFIKMNAPGGVVYSTFLKENLMKVISALLNTLQYNVMLVTISTFMYWVEIDLNDDEDLTLQTAIGERIYKIIQRIESNKDFEHDVLQQLKSLAIRPKTLEETIQNATIGDILRKLDNPKLEFDIKKAWFNELIERSVALGNDECLDTIINNYDMITIHHYRKLLEYLKSEIDRTKDETSTNDDDQNNDDDEDLYENFENIVKILRKSLNNLKTDELIEIILYRIELFGMGSSSLLQQSASLFDKLFEHFQHQESSSLNERSTEFFNKSLTSFNLNKFLLLCFENPEFIWRKYFIEACQSEQQIKNFITTFKIVQKLSSKFIEKLLNDTFPGKCEEKFYTTFLFELYHQSCIDRNKFLKEFIYKNIMEMLSDSKEYIPLLKLIKILTIIANKSSIELNAPVLIMCGQVMDQLRWDMLNYSDIKDEIVRICIDLIYTVSKKFLPKASERDKNWIKERIKSYRPITQYYFQKYTLKRDEQPKHFDKFLHPQDYVDRNDVDEFLTSTYVRCTTKETEWLARNDELLPHISNVILILNGIISELDNTNAISNYRYCILNYVNIINKILLSKISNDQNAMKDLILKIFKIIELSPNNIYDEIFMIFHEILLKILNNSLLLNDNDFINEVKKSIQNMKDCRGKELFNEKFLTIITESSV